MPNLLLMISKKSSQQAPYTVISQSTPFVAYWEMKGFQQHGVSQTTPFLQFSGAESFKKGVVWEIRRFLVHL